MSQWMDLQRATLKNEGVFASTEACRLATPQWYCVSLDEFYRSFIEFLQTKSIKEPRVCVFVDGVRKLSSEGQGNEIDSALCSLFAAHDVETEWISVSDVLEINPSSLHAAHLYSEKLRGIVRNRPGRIFLALGSGSLTDLVKHALFSEQRQDFFVSVPTALTVTAYTSAFSVLDYHGVKRTKHSREVSACFWVKPFLERTAQRYS